jgi:predicted nucleic acid-binding protein
MNKKIFVDSDIILDLLAEREKYKDAAKIFSIAYKKVIELYTSAVILANVFYILRKKEGNEKSKQRLKDLRILVKILPITEDIVDITLNSKFSDFEDGLQYFTARENNISILITRNIKDYKEKDIIIQTPEEFIKSNLELFKNQKWENGT